MTNRENVNAILHYESYERMPVVSFGYWNETLEKWAEQGHITREQADGYIRDYDNSVSDNEIMRKLGFDFNWNSCFAPANDLFPHFEPQILETTPDGHQIMRDDNGLIVSVKPGVVSIPSEIGTSLIDKAAWEELYLPKLQFSKERIDFSALQKLQQNNERDIPLGLHCGSLIGTMRNLLGVEHLSYLYVDDEELYKEVVDTFGSLSYEVTKTILESGAKFDYAHYWEDICCKSGPLVSPSVFEELVGPHYKRISDLLNLYGIDIISVDCDGWIDKLIPTWLENGVNTMFPIEVGTWNASLQPWREKYGKKIRGVGGMNKTVFAKDYAAVDAEIERLKPLIAMGGYIPCPDHRIPPDAIWENVQYYCEQMHKLSVMPVFSPNI